MRSVAAVPAPGALLRALHTHAGRLAAVVGVLRRDDGFRATIEAMDD